MKIIDVSYHNGNVDFKKVKASGIDGVIIRAGYGLNNIDKKFKANIKAAKDAGLLVGVYWFSYAYTVEMAKREAEYCLRAISGYTLELPIFFDWEYDSRSYASRNGVNAGKALITDMVKAFCQVVKNTGRSVGYYTNLDYSKNYIDTNALSGYHKWFARYANSRGGVDCDLWQYTDKGKVNGIGGNVDMNEVINASIVDKVDNSKASKPVESKPETKPSVSYYKKYTGTSVSLVDALKAIGVDASLNNRKKIAKANGISNYTGTASQNTKLLGLLKTGKLVKA